MQIRTKINGETWTIKVLSSKGMKKAGDGEPAAGLCEPQDKTIFINENYLSYETIAHEIFHAYFSDLHLTDTNSIPLEDVEEIMATMFESKGDKMVRQAKRITKQLKALADA